jgi:Putative glucoamylase/Protein of unknown function (DUF3131)
MKRSLLALLVLGLVGTATVPAAAGTSAGSGESDRSTLYRYAGDAWKSFVAMTDPATGLPHDNIGGNLDPATNSGYTSPTNIGGYLWSTVIARDLGLISRSEAERRAAQTLNTLDRLVHNEASGMFYNWYDPETGAVLYEFPDGDPIQPFVSSVDNGWLAASFMVLRTAMPGPVGRKAQALLDEMDFGVYYTANPTSHHNVGGGLMRGGFYDFEPVDECVEPSTYKGTTLWKTCFHYDTAITEARISGYIGVARGQVPQKWYFGPNRTFPANCDWSWVEQRPVGQNATYMGISVFEGAYRYRGLQFVPSWGGDMFEAMMPAMFVPEERWGKRSWGVNHPVYVQGQIEHGLLDAKYGYWGFSPASNPFGGYNVYGVDEMGMDPLGYPSDREATNVDRGFEGCREGTGLPTFGDGVVTPHASFLALPVAPEAALDNLRTMERNLDSYGPGGFYDSIAVRSNTAAKRYLALDEAMILGPIGNELLDDRLRAYFSKGEAERNLRPVMGLETFNAIPLKR